MKSAKILTTMAILSSMLTVTCGIGFAGEVQNRVENQQDRIAQGVQSGQLTSKEAAHLEKGEQKIENNREKALADGKMTPKEKKKLNKEENRQSKQIYAKKHNKRKVAA